MSTLPSRHEFRSLWKAGAAPALWREILADQETPVSAFLKLDRGGPGFLLESVEGGEVWGRYSIFGTEVGRALLCSSRPGASATLLDGRERRALAATDPMGALREVLASQLERCRTVPIPDYLRPPAPFRGGAVGWLGYDAVRHLPHVTLPPSNRDDPEAIFLLPECWAVFDRLRSRIALVAETARAADSDTGADQAFAAAEKRLDQMEARLARSVRAAPPGRCSFSRGRFDPGEEDYCRMVERAQECLRAGDVIQVVLSRRRAGRFTGDPFTAYRAMRLVNPSPYMFFLRTPGGPVLAGSSPEALIRIHRGELATRPIAGTRPRGTTPLEDEQLGRDLLADEKERAEHVMLVDLGRNDLGRVAVTGSVKVPSFMTVERYSHVMHLVSEVTATLREDCDCFDAVASVFPAGTLSGAPKVRAMQIVTELEGSRRGIYGGLVGWFGADGDADTAIAIRTAAFPAPGRFTVQAGAGIVYDSVPRREAAETEAKSEGVLKALELASRGLL